MALVLPNTGELIALKALVNHTPPENLVLKLFINDVTPAEGHTAGSYTEATGSGYASKPLTGSSWSFTSGDPSFGAYPIQSFAFTGNIGPIYGYYIVQAVSGVLVWAERHASPQSYGDGDELRVTPRIEMS